MVSQFASRYSLEQFDRATFSISTYESAEAALEAFQEALEWQEALPDLIFLDLGLDKMDGWGFLEALEELLGGNPLPKIYILSAFGKAKDRELAQHHPMVVGYIDKPLTKTSLARVFGGK